MKVLESAGAPDPVLIRGCSVGGCNRRHYARGLCSCHYKRARKSNAALPPRVASKTAAESWRRHPEIEGAAIIPLAGGLEAIVDVSDLPAIGKWRWRTSKSNSDLVSYVVRAEIRDGKAHKIRLHRFLWDTWGLPPAENVDHINLNGLDCRRANLRAATRAQSQQNRRLFKSNTSGAKGVSKQGAAWLATIKANGKQYRLGVFPTVERAAEAYREAALRLHGQFARVA